MMTMPIQHPSTPARPSTSRRLGFSLPELLIVVAIIALVIGLVIPTIAAIKLKARTMECLQNQRVLTLANYSYATSNAGRWTSSRTDAGGTVRSDGQDRANGTAHSWVKSEGANLQGTGVLQYETLGALEQGALFPYVDSLKQYLSPFEARNQYEQLAPGPQVRVRSYSFNACLGSTRPEDNPDYDAAFTRPLGTGSGTPTIPIDAYNTTSIATVKQPTRMMSTIVEDDTIDWNNRSRNLGGWVIQPQPTSQRWIDLPAPWNPRAVTLSYVDGSVEAREMQDPNLLKVMEGPPFPTDYSVNGPGPHWVKAPGLDADWEWFRARLNPGVLPNLPGQSSN
jgi:prepilin-type N-terminal cleavage/methylation domain-containing protein